MEPFININKNIECLHGIIVKRMRVFLFYLIK